MVVTDRKKVLSSGSSAPALIVVNHNGKSKESTIFNVRGICIWLP
ncbi:hypothetical protein D3OALGA1CA_847 [Olavius algarvensis associated proteobacterium Delta 3]|nr:hypothetical protein D3OALGA1CA_847 [Olavius algarvensis associated proteobacterium Delta 3]CAB5143061.1 hypothetical protein D3OALGB2SA_4350 [Olavius algarvensis associated proteobacterium Delta 3]